MTLKQTLWEAFSKYSNRQARKGDIFKYVSEDPHDSKPSAEQSILFKKKQKTKATQQHSMF